MNSHSCRKGCILFKLKDFTNLAFFIFYHFFFLCKLFDANIDAQWNLQCSEAICLPKIIFDGGLFLSASPWRQMAAATSAVCKTKVSAERMVWAVASFKDVQ